jgi:hypothetical protein
MKHLQLFESFGVDKSQGYSLDCSYYEKSFPTIDELINDVMTSGMDPNYEITFNGNVIKRFNITQFEFEKARVEAGVYYRAIKMRNYISH